MNPTSIQEDTGLIPGLIQLPWAVVQVTEDMAWIEHFCGYGVGQQLQLQFDPWLGNFCMPWVKPLKKKKKERKRKEEKIFAFSLKIRQEFTTLLRNSTDKYLFMRNEDIFPHKGLYVNVHSSIIQNSSNQKQSKCLSTSKQYMVYPCNKLILNNKEN